MMNTHLSLADLESFDPAAPQREPERRFLCPICGPDKRRDAAHRSLCLEVKTGAYKCHRCDAKGLIQEKRANKMEYIPRKARQASALARIFDVKTEISPKSETSQADADKALADEVKMEYLRSDMKSWQRAFPGSPGQIYLESRGIPAKTACAFGCGYAADWEHHELDKDRKWRLRGTDRRVVFPITDRDRVVVAADGRAIDENFIDSSKKTRCIKSLGLFQMPDRAISAAETGIIAVTEAPIDAMTLDQCGLRSIALSGKTFCEWLPSALALGNVLLATDADSAGDDCAAQLGNVLRSRGARVARLRPPDSCKDWNEFLLMFGMDKLCRLIERETARFPRLREMPARSSLPTPEDESLIWEDVFSAHNETEQRVIDYIFAVSNKLETSGGRGLDLAHPGVAAHKAEKELIAGIAASCRGDLSDDGLKYLTQIYIAEHLPDKYCEPHDWTKDVRLFSVIVKIDGATVDSATCNYVQSLIVCQFWRRQYPGGQISLIPL